MNHILDELRKPFHPSRITWKPGALNGKKDKALALAYADLRAYQNRLDEVCGMEWAVSYTPWSERIICHLTICGITRSSTGEPDSDADRMQNGGSVAEAMAFKRACAMFSLGRYLYQLPSMWVEYDAPHQRFTDKAKARLQGIIAQHYQRFLDGDATELEEAPAEDASGDTGQGADTSDAGQPATVVAEDTLQPLRKTLDELGRELYGDQWGHVRAHNIKRIAGNVGDSALKQEHIETLIAGLRKLKAQRQAA